MARPSARGRRTVRPASRPRQRSRPSWVRRNRLLIAIAALAAVGAVALAAAGGDGDAAGAGGLTGPDFHSLVVDPAEPDRLFVGGHQAVSVSGDGGRSWREVKSLRDADAMGWAFAVDRVYVSGHPGLNVSADGGRTFQPANEGLPHTDVHAFGGTADALYGASPGAGVFASTSATGRWQVRTERDGQAFFGRIVVDPDDPDHVLAGDAQRGVVESRDGGRTWRVLGSGTSATWLAASADLSVLVASGPAGAVRTDDDGESWERLELPDGASLVEVDNGGSVMYAGVHRGSRVEVWTSRDGGIRWERP